MWGKTAGLLALGAALTAPSQAQAVESVHIGVMAHNICVTDCKNAGKEQGPNVELQANFGSPGFLSFVGSPQPYVVLTVNTSGDTSSGGVGLEWSFPVSENWSIEPGFGYVIHDGETNLPFASGTPEAAAFTENHVLLGSRDLFRTSLGVTRDFDGPWEAQVFFSHLSHGQILGNGRNQGMDQLGVRFGYRFGG